MWLARDGKTFLGQDGRGPGAVTLFVTAKQNGEPIAALSYFFQATELSLDFAHFANGAAITSEMVLVNVGTRPIRPALYFYDRGGISLLPTRW